MGSAIGEDANLVAEVTAWVRESTKKPIWVKLTPNITDITAPGLSAFRAGADGVSLINTLRSLIGVDLETLRPLPTVEGYSTYGGYSSAAVKPISLRMVAEMATAAKRENFIDRSISAVGGVQTSSDAIEYLLLGASTVQSCTGPMLQGFGMIHELVAGLRNFMGRHGFQSIAEFRGKSLQYLTSFAKLADLKHGSSAQVPMDDKWDSETIQVQTQNIAAN